MESEFTQNTETQRNTRDHGFQTGKILALSIGHFIHIILGGSVPKHSATKLWRGKYPGSSLFD